MKVAHARGEAEVEIGTKFADGLYGCSWEVVANREEKTYGPSSIGGTPVFGCKLITGEMPAQWAKYVGSDGLIDFCGDSIACGIERYQESWRCSDCGRTNQEPGKPCECGGFVSDGT